MQLCGLPNFLLCSDIDVAFPKLTMLIKFMQRAFVICRLFKKQDLSIEVSNHDEAAVSPEDTQLELDPVSPSLGGQAVNDPTSVECFPAENSDASTSDTVAPVNCNKGNSVVAENQGGELLEVRKKLISSCSLKNLNVFVEMRYR